MLERQGPFDAASAVLSAWVAFLGVDLFFHAGILARLYLEPDPFLLEAAQAFRRIPLGYLSFLILVAAFFWLIRRLGITGPGAGARLGLGVGAVLALTSYLGLYSIATIRPAVALGWGVALMVELAVAGAILGMAEGGASKKRSWGVAVAILILSAILTVILQATGLAPPMELA